MFVTLGEVARAISPPLDFGGSTLGSQRAAAFMTGVFIAGFGVVAVRPTTLLTYGWLYAFVTISPATANRLNGAATMMTFRMCSLPTMATLRFGVQPMAGSPRNHARLAVSWLMPGRCVADAWPPGKCLSFFAPPAPGSIPT